MKPYRKEKLSSLIREIIAEAVHHRLHDPRVGPLTTVTRVELSADLQIAKVYLTVRGGEAVERRTIAGVRHAGGFLQRMVAGQLSIRQCPEIRFEIDERAKRVQQTMELLEENRRKNPEIFEARELDDDSAEKPHEPPADTGETSADPTGHDR